MVSVWALLRASLVVVAVVLVLLIVLWACQRRLIYLPDTDAVPPAASFFDAADDVRLTTSDGLELGAWYVYPTVGDRRVTVLVAPGNGGNRAGRVPLADALAQRGFGVLLFDYRGYGGNPGRPSESGLALDARAAYRYLVDDRGIRPERLLYFGESLGCAVVAELAAEHPPAGMLLRSPFDDLASVGRHHYPFLPVRRLLWDRFPVTEYVSRVDVPLTVVYGTADAVVPHRLSERVADAARGPVTRVALPGVGHNDAAMFGDRRILDAVDQLAERAVGR